MAVLCAALLMFVTACGEEEEPEADCTFGVADGSECVNADRCLFPSDCLAGYSCEQGTCVADQECAADEDCDLGVCGADGVCTNPDTCAENSDCVSKTYCGPENTCDPDPCGAVTCVRGSCEPGSGVCTSNDSCTEATELLDCVQGEKCVAEQCVSQDTFCDELTCERGECSFEAGGCVAAEDCQGDDSLCLEGEFCDSENNCRVDLCEFNNVECDAGVCVPEVGQCRNAEQCTSSDDCLADHVCLEGMCELEAVACGDGPGDGGCFGNRTCVYDDASLTATCEEPATCESSLDCGEGRQCGGVECVDVVACQPDMFEPNDADAEATEMAADGVAQRVMADLCSSDVDTYLVDTNNLEPFVVRGTLQVTLEVASRDVGLGQAQIELLKEQLDGSFDSVATASTGVLGADGMAMVEQAVGPVDQGVYMIKVTGVDEVSDAGVSYTLDARLVDDLAVNACETARELSNNDILTGDLGQARSTLYSSTCVDSEEPDTKVEQLYRFEVTEPSLATVTVTPAAESGEDAVVSIRSACAAGETELACANVTAEGAETIASQLVGPGVYYAMVEAGAGGALNRYDIALTLEPTACADSQNYCDDTGASNYCVAGQGLENVSCSNGCDPTTGFCFRVDGDVCATATAITAAVTETITWGELRDDYRAPSCVEAIEGSTQSDGADAAFAVEVPAGFAMRATLTMGENEQGSMYVVQDCADLEGTCLAGANAEEVDETAGTSMEMVEYGNRSADPETVTLVVDTAAGQVLSDSSLEIEFIELICDPNGADAAICDPTAAFVQTCNASGTAYEDGEDCSPWTCDTGACLSADTCADAPDMTALAKAAGGVTVTGTFDQYTGDFGGSGCGVDSGDTVGEDFVVSVDLEPGDVLIARATNTDSGFVANNPSVYVQSTCGEVSESTCLDGDAAGSGSTAEVFYTATVAETVFVTVDVDSTSSFSADEPFEFSLTVTESCDPTTYTDQCDAGGVSYCLTRGAVATFACDGGGCTDALCDVQTNDFCYDATNITAQATAAGGFSTSIDWSTFSNDFGSDIACDEVFDNGDVGGSDAYYRVDLLAGEVLLAELDEGSDTAISPSLAIIEEAGCATADNGLACLAADSDFSAVTVTYEATVDETVYLIADNEDLANVGPSDLNVQIRQSCDPTTFLPVCSANGGVEYCDGLGLVSEYSCGTGGCTNAECNTLAGGFCFDAIDLTAAASAPGGTTESVDFSTLANNVTADDVCGTLDASFDLAGPEKFFKLVLEDGEGFVASLDPLSSGEDAVLYAVTSDDCPQVNSAGSSCLVEDDPFSGSAEVEYTNTTGAQETIYLVAENDTAGTTATMDLDVQLFVACDASTYVNACAGDSVVYCGGEGFVAQYDCGPGNCSAGTCTSTDSDFCFDAEDITAQVTSAGVTKAVDFSTKGNFFETDACGLTASATAGPDAFYAVDLAAGDILSATVNRGTSGDDPAVAITKTCNTCVAGDTSGALEASTSYFAQTAETVYVVADSDNSNNSSTYDLTVSKTQAACASVLSSGTGAACAAGGDGVEVCGNDGSVVSSTCTACCTTAAAGASSPGLAIPDGDSAGTTDTLTVSGCTGNITSVLVTMDVSHSFRGDLILDLTSPNGDTVRLESDSFDGTDDYVEVYPVTRTPDGNLSDFNGANGDGTWELRLEDTFSGDTGTLNSWSVAVACQ